MIERMIVAVLLIVAGLALWIVYQRLALRRLAQTAPIDPLLSGINPNHMVIVYFTTPFCAPCRTLQKPALNQLQAELGAALKIIQIDATEQPDAADRWGVFSAPTTFVLDSATRKPLYINRGPASAELLKQQLQGVL